MNTQTRIDLETKARALRRLEFARLTNSVIDAFSESMRRHHEATLRKKSVIRVSAVIGTPV